MSEDGLPYNPEHLKDECYQCKNKDEQGRKVKGHRQGAPVCPLVRSGKYPMAGHWKKIMEGQTHGDKKSSGGKGSGKGGKRGSTAGKRDPSTGRYLPRHGAFMVQGGDDSLPEFTPSRPTPDEAERIRQAQDQAASAAVVEANEDPRNYHFITGAAETCMFAWPLAGSEFLARQMILEPHLVPAVWRPEQWKGPQVRCQNCALEGHAQRMTAQQAQTRDANNYWVENIGWYHVCPGCTYRDEMPLYLLQDWLS